MKLSVIIPAYNEAAHIDELLFYLQKNSHNPTNLEILVVDGGSSDGTPEIIDNIPFVKGIKYQKGRAKQMNKGAEAAENDILYFLHADSFPPKNFDKFILEKIEKGEAAGCFKMAFDWDHPWLFLAGWFTQFNLKFFRGGDQSLFVTKTLFNEIGGFEEAPIFEDYTFIRKLYQRKSFCVIQQSIISSARRYQENGILKLQYHYWVLYLKKWVGASKSELFQYYKKKIK